MRVRHLVPALGVLATLAPVASAADKVTWYGYSDTIFTIADNDSDVGTAEERKLGAGFSSSAVIGAKIAYDKVSGTITIWGNAGSTITLEQSFAQFQVNDMLAVKAGKSYTPVGYLSAEATGLFTINKSLIGYNSLYGANPIGAEAIISVNKELTVSAGLYNGFFGDDGQNKAFNVLDTTPPVITPDSANNKKQNTDLAIALDVVYATEKFMVNGELVIDMGAASKGAAADENAAVVQFGLNGWYQASKELKVGGEFIYRAGEPSNTGATDKDNTMAVLLHANYVLNDKMSLNGMFQYASDDNDTGAKPKSWGLQAALMTNPTGNTNFGLNFEVGYASLDGDAGASADAAGFELSTEMLLAF